MYYHIISRGLVGVSFGGILGVNFEIFLPEQNIVYCLLSLETWREDPGRRAQCSGCQS